MRSTTFESIVPGPPDKVFAWHSRPGALERLLPPWERARLLLREGGISPGARTELSLRIGPLPVKWVARHTSYQQDCFFEDIAECGPFKHWTHRHEFQPVDNGCRVIDHIDWELPFAPVSEVLLASSVEKRIQRSLSYRHRVLANDLNLHEQIAAGQQMRILIAGSSGLVGSALRSFLSAGGHEVHRLVRRKPENDRDIYWDIDQGILAPEDLEGFDAVVHLGGENIMGRWTEKKKGRIRDSRVKSATLISDTLQKLKHPPKVFLCASAVGFYGDTGKQVADESSPAGEGFLADTSQEWEEVARKAEQVGVRVVNLRIGVVLSPAGGALQAMLLPFQFGLGGPVGGGRQLMSWIALDDLIGAIYFLLFDTSIQGPVNMVAPEPISNGEFATLLGRVLRRPTILPLPEFVVRTIFGEMGLATICASVGVRPAVLTEKGYHFQFSGPEAALRHLLGR